jgi:hypothetical protein
MSFDQTERALLGRLADVLIPASDAMLSASAAGVAQQGLDRVLTARPDLAEGIRDLLGKVQGRDPAEAVTDLQQNDRATFNVLAEVAAGAYFMNPEVRQAVGYHGQGPLPIDQRPDYLEAGLLESVIRRGPIYRPTPS